MNKLTFFSLLSLLLFLPLIGMAKPQRISYMVDYGYPNAIKRLCDNMEATVSTDLAKIMISLGMNSEDAKVGSYVSYAGGDSQCYIEILNSEPRLKLKVIKSKPDYWVSNELYESGKFCLNELLDVYMSPMNIGIHRSVSYSMLQGRFCRVRHIEVSF
jgi:hypothetical protein